MGQATSLGVGKLFTTDKSKAYDSLKWVRRDSIIKNPSTDTPVFEQKGVEFPEDWSLNAINIVAQKYFTGTPGTKGREASLKQLVDRVATPLLVKDLVKVTLILRPKPKTLEKNLNIF